MSDLRPALFLDRDGIVNEEIGYLHRFEDVRFVDGIVPLIRTANQTGLFTCIVTNQAGIGRGFYSEEDFQLLMSQLRAALSERGATLDAIYFSPFHPEHGLGEYRRQTDCRKPGPGMLLRAAEEHRLDLSRSIFIGDRCSDIAAGAAAGVKNLYLLSGTEKEACNAPSPYCIIGSLQELTSDIHHFFVPIWSLRPCRNLPE